jgi:hypothetical protein
MRLPDLADKVKVVPVKVLRAVFAGVGQLVTAGEQMLGKDRGSEPGGPAEPEPRSEPDGRPARRSLDSTGNVRLLTPEDLAAKAPVATASLPLPGYDGLSIASLRARLRTLDADQLGVLIQYEEENAGRAEVVAMFERRIAKLRSSTA